jgi:uncharacterized membrane protein YcfT
VIALGVFLARFSFAAPIRYCGENSIVIYLSFFMFMAATRAELLKTGMIHDLGTVSVIVTVAGVVGPVLPFWIVRRTPFSFLFRRPEWARLPATPRKPSLVQAHYAHHPALALDGRQGGESNCAR